MSTETHAIKTEKLPRVVTDRTRLVLLVVLSLTVISLFLFIGINGHWGYVFPRRLTRLLAMILAGTAIASSTVVFQSITNNRILSPNIIGLDSLYLLVQTIIVFFFGSEHALVRSASSNFGVSLGFMLVFSIVVYQLLFKKERGNVFFILLVGIVFGTFFQSISSFLQVIIDPNEFLIVQDRMFASFTNVKTQLLGISAVVTVLTGLYFVKYKKHLDVLALGPEHAINLGVDHDKLVKRLFMAIFVLISVSTALVGPITFLGLIVVNVAYEFMHTYARSTLMIAASLISVIGLVGGQFIIERVFVFSTTLSVIINLIGGIYFLYLIVKERTSW